MSRNVTAWRTSALDQIGFWENGQKSSWFIKEIMARRVVVK